MWLIQSVDGPYEQFWGFLGEKSLTWTSVSAPAWKFPACPYKYAEVALESKTDREWKKFEAQNRKSLDVLEQNVSSNMNIETASGDLSEVRSTVEKISIVLENTCVVMNRMLGETWTLKGSESNE